MAIKTREEYIESLRKQKPKIYMLGEKVESVVDHPILGVGVNMNAQSCDFACNPEFQKLAVVQSPYVNEEISRWIHIPENAEDALAILRMMRECGGFCGVACVYREVTGQTLLCALATAYDIDKKYGTKYYGRMVDFVKYVHKNDIAIGGAVTDGKGDRQLRPIEQPDPDMFLRVVDRRKDGIVVRGGKIHVTSGAYMNYQLVGPIRLMQEDEKDYAVAFFTPIDAKGITIIVRGPETPAAWKDPADYPLSWNMSTVECLYVFDDVFVPNELIFMDGQYDCIPTFGVSFYGHHMMAKCACIAANVDLKIGATALAAETTNVDKAPHIIDNLTEMMMGAEIMWSCGVASAVQGWKHESGVWFTDPLPCSAGKVYAAKRECLDQELMLSSVGGLGATMVSEKDYKNPETRKWIEKYYKGKVGVSTEHRMKAYRLVADLTESEAAGWHHWIAIVGGAIPPELKEWVRMYYNLEKVKSRAKKLAGIE
ncbi:MAG: 4-hydroxyphenylacetate 3-hydroxylase N-terminal domain-containing protein [Pseudomonadota bacterium]